MLQLRWRTTISVVVSLMLSAAAVLVVARTSMADLTGQPCPPDQPAGYDNCSTGVSAANSTVVANATSLPADDSSSATIIVTLRDNVSTPVSGKTVTLTQTATAHSTITTVSNTTDVYGQAIFTVKDATAETVTYTATDATDGITVTQTAQVIFSAPVSASLSTVVANATSAPADGTTLVIITVSLKDGSGSPVRGKSVTLGQNSGASSVISTVIGVTSESGQAAFTVKDATAETVTYTAVDTTDAITLAQTAQVTFSAAAAAVTPNSPYANGLNGAVVQGSGSAAAVAQAIADSSGKAVEALWELTSGQWIFYLPAYPGIDGGLNSFPGPVASIFVVLS